MRNGNINGNGKFVGGLVLDTPARQTVPATLEPGRTRTETLRADATILPPDNGKRSGVDWQMIVLWFFITVSFAALAFCGYFIWAKCRSELPF
ncbi:MAG TPA: hypothetical protein VFZ59_22660 [Verrucomicrobiae bacterium]|nr:hypothetical protein [Verrucomicrobiae bacterium]